MALGNSEHPRTNLTGQRSDKDLCTQNITLLTETKEGSHKSEIYHACVVEENGTQVN